MVSETLVVMYVCQSMLFSSHGCMVWFPFSNINNNSQVTYSTLSYSFHSFFLFFPDVTDVTDDLQYILLLPLIPHIMLCSVAAVFAECGKKNYAWSHVCNDTNNCKQVNPILHLLITLVKGIWLSNS